jgi:hypothetical protein
MERIILTATQADQLEPLIRDAYRVGGTIFAQIQRATFPNHETFVVSCHLIPSESSKRLRAFLDKEAQRLSTQTKTTNTK